MLQFTGERFIPSKELINDEIGFEHLHRYHAIIPFIQNKSVLDIACGEGYGAALIGKYAQKVYGVDIDEACINWAIEHYGPTNNKLDFKKGSADRIPLADNTVDVVISFETIEHVDATIQQVFMAEVKRVLKPDGILIISTPNTVNYSARYEHHNEFHEKEFQKEEFHEFLKGHFNYAYHFEQGYEIVSTISGTDLKNIKELRVYDWERDTKNVNRKYLISIASNKEVPDSNRLSSVILQVDKDFMQLIDYIYFLQKQESQLLQEKEQLLQGNEQSLQGNEQSLQGKELLQQAIQQLEQVIQQQEKKNNQLSAALTDKETIIAEQNYKLATKQQQVDQLNGRLSEIFSSDGWRLLAIYYRLKGKLLPENSKRYKNLKKLVNKIRNKKSDDFIISDFTPPKQIEVEEITSFDTIEFPVYEQPKVSIIIPAYNGWSMNYSCLHSIFNHTMGVSYEIIFADDNSTDESANIKDYIKNIIVVRNKENLGFLKNCNHAVSFAQGEYIHFLNNDTRVTDGWLTSLVDLMDKDPNIGLAGSKLVYPNGLLQEAGGIIWNDASGWNFGHKQNPESPEYNYVKEVDYISGASILVRKSCWEKLGGFDERYVPAYYEDTDLAFAIRNLNMKVVYQPLSVVVHYEGFSHGSDHNENTGLTNIKSYQQLNKSKFYEKWSNVLINKPDNAINVFWARDNSYNKKTIVIIDHYVPHFDKDAGSRLTFRMLSLLVKLGYNVKFIGDNFYKHEPYTTVLQQMGIEVLYGPWYRDNWKSWIADNEKYIDFFFVHRPHIATKYIDAIRSITNSKIVYFGHDLHYLRELRQYEIEKDPQLLKSSEKWKKIETELVKKSDIALTLSIDEKNILERDTQSDRIHILPAYYYTRFNDPIPDFSDRNNLLFVGGFSHEPNEDGVIWFANQVLPLIQQTIPDIKLLIVGSNPPETIKNLASPNKQVLGYVTEEELQKLYDHSKVVVIPLRYGAGVKGKTIEALHHAVPFVTTSIGIEGMENIDEVTQGYNRPDDFANAVIDLYNNNAMLVSQSKKGVDYANKYLSEERTRQLFLNIFS